MEYRIQGKTLKDIADSIRSVDPNIQALSPQEMDDEIRRLTAVVDQTYDSESSNPISGKAVKQAIETLSEKPDYNQNDSTAKDYIKNRPCYTEEVETTLTLLDGTFDFEEAQPGLYGYFQESSFTFEEGKTYTVVFDGTSYNCTCYIINGAIAVLGNSSLFGVPGGNNEPFLMFVADGMVEIGTNLTDASHTVTITTQGIITNIKQLDAKYLPDEIYTNIASKMDTENPTGTGSFSLNRKADTTIGNYSFAEGTNTTASGAHSHAEGSNTTASGDLGAHAEGNNTTASGAYGAHAEGQYTTASGQRSHAEGNYTTALGVASHAEGESTAASGKYSHAEGSSKYNFSSVVTKTNPTNADIITAWESRKFSVAKGTSSHVEGNDSLALGEQSHAEGYYTTASRMASHAEGNNTTASGNWSHAEGLRTTASGESSHAEGNYTTALGVASHAEGLYTKARSYQHAQGKYNIEDSADTYADIIGNGTRDTARSNAATVDWSGNAWYAGDVYVGSTSGTNKDEGSKKLATEEYVDSKQVQSDYEQNDSTAKDYIKNKPAIATNDDAMDFLAEMGMVTPVTNSNGEILISSSNEIYSL